MDSCLELAEASLNAEVQNGVSAAVTCECEILESLIYLVSLDLP